MADGRRPWVSTPFASLNRVYPPTQPKLKPSPCPAVPVSHIYPGREMSRCLATPFSEAGPRRACTLRLARCICLPVHLVPPLIPRAVSERPPCRPQGGAGDPSARGETRTGVCASSTAADPRRGAQDWADRVASNPGLGPSVRGWVRRAISRVKESPRLFRINLYSHGEVGFCANKLTTR